MPSRSLPHKTVPVRTKRPALVVICPTGRVHYESRAWARKATGREPEYCRRCHGWHLEPR